MNESRPHTTIGLKKATKEKLDRARAPGQCYDGFLCQLVDFWQQSHLESRPGARTHKRGLVGASRK
jgi:hypothetical protein